MKLPDPPLLVITNRKMTSRPLMTVLAEALAGGCRWILVREKDLSQHDLVVLTGEIINLARPYDAFVSVSSNVQATVAAQARGVHLPWGSDVQYARQTVGPMRWVGVSAHSLAEAETAARAGADYITLSPIFATESKPNYGPALDLQGLRGVARALTIPVIALAGITAENAADCLHAGAAGVAVMGTVMRAVDPFATVRQLVEALRR